MSSRLEYVKRASQSVIAVQVDLETAGFTYEKWGATQTCKPGDWLVNNGGDVYTIDRDTFARTHRQTGPGTFVKVTPVWAEVATDPGVVRTKEGHFRNCRRQGLRRDALRGNPELRHQHKAWRAGS